MTEYERVREQVAQCLYEHHHPRMYHTFTELRDNYPQSAEAIRSQADQILSLNGIEIRANAQSLPENPSKLPTAALFKEYAEAQQDMLKAGFIKVIPKEK